jgi:hypothetical protein
VVVPRDLSLSQISLGNRSCILCFIWRTREIYDTVAELEIETAAAYASGMMGGESACVIELQRRIDHLIQETRLAALTPPVYVR